MEEMVFVEEEVTQMLLFLEERMALLELTLKHGTDLHGQKLMI